MGNPRGYWCLLQQRQGLSVTVEGANAFTVNSARQIISSKLLVPAGGNVYLEEPAYADADGTSGVGFIAQQESVALICGNRPAFKARVDGSKVVCETAGVLALNPANTNPLPQEATICAIWVYQQIGLGSQTYSVLSSGNAPSAFKGDVLIGHDPARDHGILSHAKKPQTGYNLEVYGSFLQSKSSGNATFEGAASFASTLSVGGAATFSASATFSSQAEVSGSTSSFAPKCQVAESGVVEGNPSANVQLSFASGTFHKFSLTQSVTFAMPTATNSNLPLLGSSLTVVIYTANGGNNATFTDVDWPNGDTPTVTQAAGRMDVFTFFHDGIKWRGTVVQNFSQN